MDILDELDFDKIHSVMKFLDWRWSTSEDGLEVPTISEMRKTCRKYLILTAEHCLTEKSKEYYTATGGFRFEGRLYDDGFLFLRVAFEVTDHDNAE